MWADWTNRFVWVVLLVTFGFGWIGWADDYKKVVNRDPEGMSSRRKFFWQALIGIIAAVYLSFAVSAPRSEEHTSELQSLMRISYAVFCLKKKKSKRNTTYISFNQTKK